MKNQTSPNVALIPLDEHGNPLVTGNMKFLCNGEISINLERTCFECDADDPDPDCEICHGEIDYTENMKLDWTTIKQAYDIMAKAAIAEKPKYSPDQDALREEIERLRKENDALRAENAKLQLLVRSEEQVVDDCNALARIFYSMHGCAVGDDFKFYEAHHPLEKLCWSMAAAAYEKFSGTDVENALAEIEDSSQQGAQA